METKNEMLEHALYYLRQGFSVIPIDFDGRTKGKKLDDDKFPLIVTDPYLNAPPTEEEVIAWWTRWPWAAIGLPTGRVSGVTVVDTEREADLTLFNLDDFDTPTAKSGGGGKHYYFKYDPDVGNRVKFAPFHDIRNDRGYIIAPPSPHKTGGKYEWIVPWGAITPAPFPLVLREAAIKTAKIGREELTKALADGVLDGVRDNSATMVVGSLLAKYNVRDWEPIVWSLLQSWNQTKVKPPLGDDQLRKCFESIARRELAKRKVQGSTQSMFSMTPESIESTTGMAITHDIEDATVTFSFRDIGFSKNRALETDLLVSYNVSGLKSLEYGTRININSMSARRELAGELGRAFGQETPWSLMLANAAPVLKRYAIDRSVSKTVWEIEPRGEKPENLLGSLLADKATNLLFGMGGGGKTYLCARIAIALASKGAFLDFMASKQTSVLFLDYEDVGEEFRARIEELASGIQPSPDPDTLARIRYRNAGGVPIHDLLPQLKEEILRNDIGLLIIDSVGSACGNELEKAESATGYWNDLNSLGITTLSIAHVAKGGTENADGGINEKGQRSAFGSVFFHNGARNTWNLVAQDGEDDVLRVCLYHRKSNRGRKSGMVPVEIDFSQLEGKNTVTITKGREADWEEAKPLTARILYFLKQGKKTRVEIEEEFEGFNKSTVKSSLGRLKRQGKIVLLGGQKGEYELVV